MNWLILQEALKAPAPCINYNYYIILNENFKFYLVGRPPFLAAQLGRYYETTGEDVTGSTRIGDLNVPGARGSSCKVEGTSNLLGTEHVHASRGNGRFSGFHQLDNGYGGATKIQEIASGQVRDIHDRVCGRKIRSDCLYDRRYWIRSKKVTLVYISQKILAVPYVRHCDLYRGIQCFFACCAICITNKKGACIKSRIVVFR